MMPKSLTVGQKVNVCRAMHNRDSYYGPAEVVQVVGDETCVEFSNGDQVWFKTALRILEGMADE